MYAMEDKAIEWCPIKKNWNISQVSIRGKKKKRVGKKDRGKEGGRRSMMMRKSMRKKTIDLLQEIGLHNCGSLCETAVSSYNARS